MSTIDKSKLATLRELGFFLAEKDDQQREPYEAEVLTVGCPECHAPLGEYCQTLHVFSTNGPTNHLHKSRRELAKHKINVLSNVDKALIVQYAFLRICECVSANSDKIMGKAFQPVEVQTFFAQEAIKELKNLGALK